MRITKKKSHNPFNMSGFSPKYGPKIDYGNKKKIKILSRQLLNLKWIKKVAISFIFLY